MGQVKARREALVTRALDNAVLITVAAGNEETRLVITTTYPQPAVRDQSLLAVDDVFVVKNLARSLSRLETSPFSGVELLFHLRGGKAPAADFFNYGIETKILAEVDLRTAFTLLGSDDDHPGVSPRTVDGSGRSAFQHFHTLNIVRIDVRQAVRSAFLTTGVSSGSITASTRDLHIRQVDTIDDDQRLVVTTQGRYPPQTHGITAPGSPGCLRNINPGKLTVKRPVNRLLAGCPGQFITTHGSYRIGQIRPLNRTRQTRHDDLAQVSDVFFHDDIDFIGRRGDIHRLGGETGVGQH